MKRLTELDFLGCGRIIGVDTYNLFKGLSMPEVKLLADAIEKFVAYEDTGFTPEQIIEAQKAMNAALGLACGVQAARDEVTRLQRERDAAVADMEFNADGNGCFKICITHLCYRCKDGSEFKWRGVQEGDL